MIKLSQLFRSRFKIYLSSNLHSNLIMLSWWAKAWVMVFIKLSLGWDWETSIYVRLLCRGFFISCKDIESSCSLQSFFCGRWLSAQKKSEISFSFSVGFRHKDLANLLRLKLVEKYEWQSIFRFSYFPYFATDSSTFFSWNLNFWRI